MATKLRNVGSGQRTSAEPWNQEGSTRENNRRDHDLPGPAEDEEQRRENDCPRTPAREGRLRLQN